MGKSRSESEVVSKTHRFKWARIGLLDRQISILEMSVASNRGVRILHEVRADIDHMKQMLKLEHQHRLSRQIKNGSYGQKIWHSSTECLSRNIDERKKNFRINSYFINELNSIAVECSCVNHEMRLRFNNKTMRLEVSAKASFGGRWVKANIDLGVEPVVFSSMAMEVRRTILAGMGML